MSRLSNDALPGWISWFRLVLAEAQESAPLDPSDDALWSWDLRPAPKAPSIPWLVKRDPTRRRVRPYLRISWMAVVKELLRPDANRLALVALVRAAPYLAPGDAVLAQQLAQIGKALQTGLAAPQSDDPLFAASLAAHASPIALDPASVRRWAGAARTAFAAVAPEAHQVALSTSLVVDPFLVANEYARKRIRVPPGRKTLVKDLDALGTELHCLLGSLPIDGVHYVSGRIVIDWNQLYAAYMAMDFDRPMYMDLAVRPEGLHPEIMRQRFERTKAARGLYPTADKYARALEDFPVGGLYTVIDAVAARRRISSKPNSPSLPEQARTTRRAYAPAAVTREYEGVEIYFIRRKNSFLMTLPHDVAANGIVLDGRPFYSVKEVAGLHLPATFVTWALGVVKTLTPTVYANEVRRVKSAAQTERIRATKGSGSGMFSKAEDAILIDYLDTRAFGPIKAPEVEAIASMLPGRSAAGVRRRLRTLIGARAKLQGWDYFRLTSWWPGGTLAQSIYASCRRH